MGWAVFCAGPRSEQLRRPGARERTPPGGGCVLSPPRPSRSASWVAAGAPSQVCRVSLLGSWSLAATLPADVNRPESQEVLVINWKPVRSLVGDAVSRAEFAPFRLWLAPSCPLPPVGDGLVPSLLALRWYSLSPLLCEWLAVP